MKLFRLVWSASRHKSIVFWSNDKSSITYHGHLHVERVAGLDKNQVIELGKSSIQEIEVPTHDAGAFAKWLNAELYPESLGPSGGFRL